jgi:branched-chain amino acid transport system substrate-binding protein
VLGAALLVVVTLLVPSVQSAPAGQPIVIGATIAQSGVFSRASRPQLTAYRLAEEVVNERGGLLGRPVKLVLYDDQSNPSQGVILYRRLIFQDKVDLLLGPFSSAVTFAVAPVIDQARIPTLAPQAGDPRIWPEGRRYVFGILPSNFVYLTGALELAKERNLHNIAIVYQDSAAPNAVAEGLRRKAKEFGLTIVMDESYPTDATDFTTTMAKAKRLNAEVVVGGGYINDDIGLTKAAKAVDFNVRMICLMIGTADPNFTKELGKDAELVMGNTNWEPYFNTPGNEDFVRRYKAKYNEDPYYDTAASYAAFMLTVEAVQKVGRLDREALRSWFSQTKTQTLFGDYGVDRNGLQIAKQPAIFQWQKGQRVIVWPAKLQTGSLVIPSSFWSK